MCLPLEVLADSSVSRLSVATVPSTLMFTEAQCGSRRQRWTARAHPWPSSSFRLRQLSMQAPRAHGASLNTFFSSHGKSSPAKGPSGPCSTRTSFAARTSPTACVQAAASATIKKRIPDERPSPATAGVCDGVAIHCGIPTTAAQRTLGDEVCREVKEPGVRRGRRNDGAATNRHRPVLVRRCTRIGWKKCRPADLE
eukprot:scaffold175_cov150-Isochrysis_galbana.AAC.5